MLDTARGLGVAAGDLVRLATRRGHAEVRARVSRDIRFERYSSRSIGQGARATIG